MENNGNTSGGPTDALFQPATQSQSPLQQTNQFKPNGPGQEMHDMGGINLSPEQATRAWSQLVDSGRMSREEASQRMQAEGLQGLKPPEVKSQWESSFDEWSAPAKAAHEYHLPQLGDFNDPENGQRFKDADANLREIFLASRAPAQFAKGFMKEFVEADRGLKGLSDSQTKLKLQRERDILIKHYGGEKQLNEKAKIISDFADEIEAKTPGAKAFFIDSATINASAFNLLLGHITGLRTRFGAKLP